MTKSLRIVASALLAGALSSAYAWNAVGHEVVAAIAQSNLTPAARAEADRLLKATGTTDFVSVASWADETRTKENGPWHYEDHYFRQDGQPAKNKAEEENVVWAIDKFSKVLSDKTKSDAERADALRYVIHFVGDIHQPLHATALENDALPQGDAGGNRYPIGVAPEFATMERAPKNLHSLWDMGAGLFNFEPDIKSASGEARIQGEASMLAAALPRESFPELSKTDPEQWALESFEDAKRVVYATPMNEVPSPEYLTKGRTLAAQRVTLAGYRLADLLNRLLK